MHSFLCVCVHVLFFFLLVVDIHMEVKTICYVVQYAVHTELCSTNLFSPEFLVVYWYPFLNKILLTILK